MKIAKRITALLLAVSCLMGMTACSSNQPTAAAPKPALLAVSFGTSYNNNRNVSIGALESALQEAYPNYDVRRAFTSQIIIDVLSSRDGVKIDNVTEAMDRLVADGVKDVVIQPTHVMPGYEYNDVLNEISGYADRFNSLKIGKPLLTEEEDYTALVGVLGEETARYSKEGTALVFMGHGTEHQANSTYAKLQESLTAAGYENYYVGTVESTLNLEEVLALVKAKNYNKVVLMPLMIVAGDHANNDMAGDEEDSWKSAFEAAGYEVECVLTGLGQYAGVQQMIVAHAAAAMAQ